jgi:hypothetical protein
MVGGAGFPAESRRLAVREGEADADTTVFHSNPLYDQMEQLPALFKSHRF